MGCSDVYGEVLNCDVLGINGKVNIIVELKTNLSFKLIDQAIDRLHLAQYVYIAIPRRKDHIPRCVEEILKRRNIGLLQIDRDKWSNKLIVGRTIAAKYNRYATKYQRSGTSIRNYIKPYHKDQIGGVKSGETITDYSITIDNIKDFLKYRKRGNWTTVAEILDHCETHYSNPKQSVRDTLQAHWNSNWCESKKEKGKMYFRYKEQT